jgi:CO/xanthine dehydrogenase FAD-binding subunit
MADQPNQVFYPASFAELFSAWGNYPDAAPFAGGTGLLRGQGRHTLDLPPMILSLEKIEDLHRISRSEHFLEIGAMVKLSSIINLGKIVPGVLRRCIENIAGPQLRNMATIGGNVCYPGGRLDCSAPLAALDAQYELRTAQSSRWISTSRYSTLSPAGNLGPQELLSRIRLPLDNWDYSAYKKFEGQASRSKAAVFLVKTQKDILNDIRIVYKADMIWRDKTSESILIGKTLPISRRIAADFAEHWKEYLLGIEAIGELAGKELINFIEMNVYNLAD